LSGDKNMAVVLPLILLSNKEVGQQVFGKQGD